MITLNADREDLGKLIKGFWPAAQIELTQGRITLANPESGLRASLGNLSPALEIHYQDFHFRLNDLRIEPDGVKLSGEVPTS